MLSESSMLVFFLSPRQNFKIFSPVRITYCFWQTPKLCDNLIAIQIHISEFMGFFYFIQNSVFKPFLSTP